MIQFDGVKSGSDAKKSITVIGATNLPQQLDDAVLRRFPKRILVPNPEAGARYGLLRALMKKQRYNMTEDDFQHIVTKTDGYSCSDLTMLCNDAAMGPLRSLSGAFLLRAKKSDIPYIGAQHFESSLKNIRASLPPENLKHYHKWDEQFGSKLFLTMDVLPQDMKSLPLTSVKEEVEEKIRKEKENENNENGNNNNNNNNNNGANVSVEDRDD